MGRPEKGNWYANEVVFYTFDGTLLNGTYFSFSGFNINPWSLEHKSGVLSQIVDSKWGHTTEWLELQLFFLSYSFIWTE